MNAKNTLTAVAVTVLGFLPGQAQERLEYSATAIGAGASGDFAPYLFTSGTHGKTPMADAALLDIEVHKDFNLRRRFSWEAGAEVLAGSSGKAGYMQFNAAADVWTINDQGPAMAWLQQLYASVKWRGVMLSAGMKERESVIVDNTLSSGDLINGSSARPIPQVRAGFVDFQDIPLTRGWVQVEGCLAYGKMTDSDYLRNHYNYWNGHIATDVLYTYKRIYFRTRTDRALSVTIGMQSAGTFGGTSTWYQRGVETRTQKNRQNLRAFWDMLFPTRGNGDGYMEGSSLGSWDFKARYRLKDSHEIAGYFQWLWEDGSSMARRNKWDGLWGVEYRRSDGRAHVLEAAVAEYIDFRDQSGPLHWAPGDYPGTDITTEATGGDDYYNNTTLNAYANYGLPLGTPFIAGPLYNTNGRIQFLHTRSRGFHIAARGHVVPAVTWRAAVSHAVAWGSGREFINDPLHNTSALVGAGWDAAALLPGLSATAAFSFDTGSLRGDTFGAQITVTYSGNISFGK